MLEKKAALSYAKREFLNDPFRQSPAQIHCVVKEMYEYEIRLSDCSGRITLHGNLIGDNYGGKNGQPGLSSLENCYLKIDTLVKNLLSLKEFIQANESELLNRSATVKKVQRFHGFCRENNECEEVARDKSVVNGLHTNHMGINHAGYYRHAVNQPVAAPHDY